MTERGEGTGVTDRSEGRGVRRGVRGQDLVITAVEDEIVRVALRLVGGAPLLEVGGEKRPRNGVRKIRKRCPCEERGVVC